MSPLLCGYGEGDEMTRYEKSATIPISTPTEEKFTTEVEKSNIYLINI